MGSEEEGSAHRVSEMKMTVALVLHLCLTAALTVAVF